MTKSLLARTIEEDHLQDVLVNSARMMADILLFFLNHPDLYCSAAGPDGTPVRSAAAADITPQLDVCLQQHVLPLLPIMMKEKDPMPLYAQKILAQLLPRCALPAPLGLVLEDLLDEHFCGLFSVQRCSCGAVVSSLLTILLPLTMSFIDVRRADQLYLDPCHMYQLHTITHLSIFGERHTRLRG